MIIKLLEYLYWKWNDKKWIVKLMNRTTGAISYNILIKYKKEENNILYVYLDLIGIVYSIITLTIFFILYTFNILILSESFIDKYKIYLFIVFSIFILKLVYNLLYGLYIKFRNNNIEIWDKAVKTLWHYINFFLNINIILYLLNINFILFLEYNILLVLDNFCLLIMFSYWYLFSYKIIGVRIVNFITYPWIGMLILLVLIKYTNKWEYWYKKYLSKYCVIYKSKLENLSDVKKKKRKKKKDLKKVNRNFKKDIRILESAIKLLDKEKKLKIKK